VLEQRDPPAHERGDDPGLVSQVPKVAVPRERHEDVRAGEKRDRRESNVHQFSCFRRGRCFGEIDLTISFGVPFFANGTWARLIASLISVLIAGLSRSFADASLIWRTTLPLPFRSCSGSGRLGPSLMKHSVR